MVTMFLKILKTFFLKCKLEKKIAKILEKIAKLSKQQFKKKKPGYK
jgi:hypothetical protein